MGEDYRILNAGDNISFKKKIDAINWCTEKEYNSNVTWQPACWPSNNPKSSSFRIWFPRLSDKQGGEYIPTSAGFINYLSEDGRYFIFDDTNGYNPDPDDRYLGLSIIFAKDYNGDYIYRGVYKLDVEKSGPNHFVHERIATAVKLIGKPVHGFELLNEVETNEADSINTPLKPKKKYIIGNGMIRYVCGRCDTTFTKAPRCPACGQLIKE